MELINKYYPEIGIDKELLFAKLGTIYLEWNSKVNLISRKDIPNLYERHILHSLSIAKFFKFSREAKILDLGTGGGFPGLPLAIMFPETQFHLVDSIAKKINVVAEIAKTLELRNLRVQQIRAEKLRGPYDFMICRAVAPLITLHRWTDGKLRKGFSLDGKANGLLCLKGGDLTEEINELGLPAHQYELSSVFEEEFFATKKILHVPL